jgi:hypothetical protein
MGPGLRRDDVCCSHFPSIEIIRISIPMFRRHANDETILLRMKPFSTLRADIPKRSLRSVLLNEAPSSGDTGS